MMDRHTDRHVGKQTLMNRSSLLYLPLELHLTNLNPYTPAAREGVTHHSCLVARHVATPKVK